MSVEAETWVAVFSRWLGYVALAWVSYLIYQVSGISISVSDQLAKLVERRRTHTPQIRVIPATPSVPENSVEEMFAALNQSLNATAEQASASPLPPIPIVVRTNPQNASFVLHSPNRAKNKEVAMGGAASKETGDTPQELGGEASTEQPRLPQSSCGVQPSSASAASSESGDCGDRLCDPANRFHVTRCSFSVDTATSSGLPMKILTHDDVCPPGTLISSDLTSGNDSHSHNQCRGVDPHGSVAERVDPLDNLLTSPVAASGEGQNYSTQNNNVNYDSNHNTAKPTTAAGAVSARISPHGNANTVGGGDLHLPPDLNIASSFASSASNPAYDSFRPANVAPADSMQARSPLHLDIDEVKQQQQTTEAAWSSTALSTSPSSSPQSSRGSSANRIGAVGSRASGRIHQTDGGATAPTSAGGWKTGGDPLLMQMLCDIDNVDDCCQLTRKESVDEPVPLPGFGEHEVTTAESRAGSGEGAGILCATIVVGGVQESDVKCSPVNLSGNLSGPSSVADSEAGGAVSEGHAGGQGGSGGETRGETVSAETVAEVGVDLDELENEAKSVRCNLPSVEPIRGISDSCSSDEDGVEIVQNALGFSDEDEVDSSVSSRMLPQKNLPAEAVSPGGESKPIRLPDFKTPPRPSKMFRDLADDLDSLEKDDVQKDADHKDDSAPQLHVVNVLDGILFPNGGERRILPTFEDGGDYEMVYRDKLERLTVGGDHSFGEARSGASTPDSAVLRGKKPIREEDFNGLLPPLSPDPGYDSYSERLLASPDDCFERSTHSLARSASPSQLGVIAEEDEDRPRSAPVTASTEKPPTYQESVPASESTPSRGAGILDPTFVSQLRKNLHASPRAQEFEESINTMLAEADGRVKTSNEHIVESDEMRRIERTSVMPTNRPERETTDDVEVMVRL